MTASQLTRRIRIWLGLFLAGLVLSGLSAFPLEGEMRLATAVLGISSQPASSSETGVRAWLRLVRDGVVETNRRYPFLAYGTDWLAFGHLVIAVAFFGPMRDPVRNRWIITFGLVACAGVIPVAFIAGHVRGIPLAWRLLDCCFGIFGAIPLLVCRHYIRLLEERDAQP
jgi:hypothetical protein